MSDDERPCPTCGGFDLVLVPDEPLEGWDMLSCKNCGRTLEIGRPEEGPLVDPEWKAPPKTQASDRYGLDDYGGLT